MHPVMALSTPDRRPAGRRRRGGAASANRRAVQPADDRDRLTLAAMVAVPTFILVVFVIVPTIASIVLSFTSWNGIGGLGAIKFIGLENYNDLVTVYKPFFPALTHNLIWLAFFLLVATPLGIFFAVLLDKEIRGTRFYQSALYLPVVLSLAIVGFIWQLQYAPEEGLINNVLGRTAQGNQISWLGDPDINLWAVLVAASWRQVGLRDGPLPGRPQVGRHTLREAAAIDGANERQTFFRVVFPVMRPINIVDPRHHDHRVAARVRPRVHHQQGPQRPRAAVDARHEQHHR